MEKGWVRLHRQILDNHFLMRDANAYIVFTRLLILVNDKGEYATGRRQLAELFYMNDRTLYGILIRLEEQGMIRLESRVKYTVICVQNWKHYQSPSNRGGKKDATERATLAKQGSFDDIATDLATTAQPQRNHSATTAQHSNKNKEYRIKNRDSFVDSDKSDPRETNRKKLFEMLINELGFSNQVKPTDGRLRKLQARLKTYKPSEIVQAAKNLGCDQYMQGDNDNGKRYGNIDYLLRSDEILDRWLLVNEKLDVKKEREELEKYA